MSTQQQLIVARLAVYKIESGVYEFNVSNGTDTLYEDADFVSIEANSQRQRAGQAVTV
ncbi:MAG: hypothetical protein ACOZE7_07110 [Pseudomonadota bacterium]